MIIDRQDIALYFQGTTILLPSGEPFHIQEGTLQKRDGTTELIGYKENLDIDKDRRFIMGNWADRFCNATIKQSADDEEIFPLCKKIITKPGYRQLEHFVLNARVMPIRGAKKALHNTNCAAWMWPRGTGRGPFVDKADLWADINAYGLDARLPKLAKILLLDPVYCTYQEAVRSVFEFKRLAATWCPEFCVAPETGFKFPALIYRDRLIGYVRPDASVVVGEQFRPFREALSESGVRDITYE